MGDRDRCRGLLTRGLAELSVEASPDQLRDLLELARLLERWSARINLTGHRTVEGIVRHLVLEAAALLAQLPPLESLADLGSGAGFPGLPIALLRPRWRLTLVEARERRHHFQRAAARQLQIRNARLVLGRAEALEPTLHDAAVAQAMAQPARALRWMRRWVRVGGLVLLPGSAAQREDALADTPWLVPVHQVRYRVPCGGPERRLWVGRVDPLGCGPG